MSWINSKYWMKAAEKADMASPNENIKANLCFAKRLTCLMRKGLIRFPSSEETQETANNLASQLKIKKCEELKAMISNTISRTIEKINEQGSKIPKPFPCVSEKMMKAALNHCSRGGCKSGVVNPVPFPSSSSIASPSAVPTNTCPENLPSLPPDIKRQLGKFFQEQLNEVAKPQPTESTTLPKKYVHGGHLATTAITCGFLLVIVSMALFFAMAYGGFWYAEKYPEKRIPGPVRGCMKIIGAWNKDNAAYYKRQAVYATKAAEEQLAVVERLETVDKASTEKKVVVVEKEVLTPSENLGGENWEVDICACGKSAAGKSL